MWLFLTFTECLQNERRIVYAPKHRQKSFEQRNKFANNCKYFLNSTPPAFMHAFDHFVKFVTDFIVSVICSACLLVMVVSTVTSFTEITNKLSINKLNLLIVFKVCHCNIINNSTIVPICFYSKRLS